MSDLPDIRGQEQKPQQRNIHFYDGPHIAKIFAYFMHLKKPNVKKDIPMMLMSGKSLYNPHKKVFDNFAEIAKKNSFDVVPYAKFCVDNGISAKNIEICLTSSNLLAKYNEMNKEALRLKKIYKWFVESAFNIASEAVEMDFFSTKDFIRMLVETKQIAAYIVSGRISPYYFAAIPKFNKAVPKLDYFSRIELQPVERWYEIYHSDVNKAFLQERNIMVNPLEFTDLLMKKIKEKKSTSSRI